jgi:thiaminase (transcriptional activator TenA)
MSCVASSPGPHFRSLWVLHDDSDDFDTIEECVMADIDFEHGLFGRLRAAAGAEWRGYVDHPFVQQLGAGTLPEICFKRFLSQDYLFLIHFARACGLAVFKSTSPEDIKAAAAALNAILMEMPLHVEYCRSWGLTEEWLAAEPEARETLTYTRYVIDVGMTGDILDLCAALIPCVAGYAEAGKRLISAQDTVIDGNPYRAWIRTYDSNPYKESVKEAIEQLDKLGKRVGGDARFERLAQIFITATRLEADFWQMGLNAAG